MLSACAAPDEELSWVASAACVVEFVARSVVVVELANVLTPMDLDVVPIVDNALEATVFSGVPIASVFTVGLSVAADGNVMLDGRAAAELVPGGRVGVAVAADEGGTLVEVKAAVLL